LAAEEAKRDEEPEPVGGSRLPSLQHGLLDERPDEPTDLLGVETIPGTDRLGSVESEPAREHRQAGPQQTLVRAQEPVAPVDCRLERLLARRHAAVPGAEASDPGTEPTIERVQAKGVEADRCQLERERDAVEVGAHTED